jgi:hypothetical protein
MLQDTRIFTDMKSVLVKDGITTIRSSLVDKNGLPTPLDMIKTFICIKLTAGTVSFKYFI